jgi:hypothetical protein
MRPYTLSIYKGKERMSIINTKGEKKGIGVQRERRMYTFLMQERGGPGLFSYYLCPQYCSFSPGCWYEVGICSVCLFLFS